MSTTIRDGKETIRLPPVGVVRDQTSDFGMESCHKLIKLLSDSNSIYHVRIVTLNAIGKLEKSATAFVCLDKVVQSSGMKYFKFYININSCMRTNFYMHGKSTVVKPYLHSNTGGLKMFGF